MFSYLKVNSGGARNLNLSNKKDDNTNEIKKIKYLILLIFIVMFTVTGGTYAYLAFAASNNTISGTTATADLELVVERKLPSNVGVMVPQLEEYLGSAISDTYNCIDGNGNTVCQVYKATVTNKSTATVEISGSIKFSGINNMPNLKWKRINDERTLGEYTSNKAST